MKLSKNPNIGIGMGIGLNMNDRPKTDNFDLRGRNIIQSFNSNKSFSAAMRSSQDFGAFRNSVASSMADGNLFPDKADS